MSLLLLSFVLPDIKGCQALQIAVHPESTPTGLPCRRIELTAIGVLRLRCLVIENRERLGFQQLRIAHTQQLLFHMLSLLFFHFTAIILYKHKAHYIDR